MKMKNNISSTFCGFLFISACLFAACSKQETPTQPNRAKPLYIEVAPSTYAETNSLSANETDIKKIRVYVFNDDGSLDNMVTSTNTPVKVGVSAGLKTVAVVINESANSSGALAAANTLNGVEHATFSLKDPEYGRPQVTAGTTNTEFGSRPSSSYTLPMYGKTRVTVNSMPGTASPMPVKVLVERSVARIDIYLRKKYGETKSCVFDNSKGAGHYSGGVIFVAGSYPGNRGYYSPGSKMFFEFAHDTYFAHPGALTLAAATSEAPTDRSGFTRAISFYCPETDLSNMPSMGSGVKSRMSLRLYESISWDGAPPITLPASGYIELNPPGAKLERNKIYRLYVTLNSPNEICDMEVEVCPWEVEPVQTQPVAHDDVTNCYIVASGGEVHIPLKQIYDAYASHPELGGPLSETEVPTVEQLWDPISGYPDGGIRALSIEGTGMNRDKYIRVVVKQNTDIIPFDDNVLIALKINGDIVWSFHIWITDYNPNHPASQRTSTDLPGIVMMDRCLGEAPRSNDKFYKRAAPGLAYQWGRPAPFGTYGLFGRIGIPYTDDYSRAFRFLSEEIRYPTAGSLIRFYEYKDENGSIKFINPVSLWYGENGKKTIYDPCPRGWKVMPKSVFDATGDFSNFTYHADSGSEIGIADPLFRHADWGDFSMAGCYWYDYGYQASYGTRSTMWVVSTEELNYWVIEPNKGSKLYSVSLDNLDTAMVRCVKE